MEPASGRTPSDRGTVSSQPRRWGSSAVRSNRRKRIGASILRRSWACGSSSHRLPAERDLQAHLAGGGLRPAVPAPARQQDGAEGGAGEAQHWELLERAPWHEGNPYVCAGSRPGSRYSNIEKPWRRIREAAGLPDVRIHDLRHSFASVGVGAGIGLPIVGHILGHRQPATTARYAHFENEPVQRAAELLTDAISRALAGGDGSDGSGAT